MVSLSVAWMAEQSAYISVSAMVAWSANESAVEMVDCLAIQWAAKLAALKDER